MREQRAATLGLLALCACASIPDTHFYRLAAPELRRAPEPIAGVLAIETLEADAAYTDDRILYRKSPYELDYYNYHRWVAAPAVQLTDYLREAYARSGWFAQVVIGPTRSNTTILRGRVTSFDEVDSSPTRWLARVALELELRDTQSSEVLWSRAFVETQVVPKQDPEGVAMALSVAMQRVVRASGPELAHALAERAATAAAQPAQTLQ